MWISALLFVTFGCICEMDFFGTDRREKGGAFCVFFRSRKDDDDAAAKDGLVFCFLEEMGLSTR